VHLISTKLPKNITEFRLKVLFLSRVMNCWISITKYLSPLPIWRKLIK